MAALGMPTPDSPRPAKLEVRWKPGQPDERVFSVVIAKVDEKGKETYLADVTIDLRIPDLGEIQRVTAAGAKPVMIAQLEPGGKGDVLKMEHATDVYEAIGDFS